MAVHAFGFTCTTFLGACSAQFGQSVDVHVRLPRSAYLLETGKVRLCKVTGHRLHPSYNHPAVSALRRKERNSLICNQQMSADLQNSDLWLTSGYCNLELSSLAWEGENICFPIRNISTKCKSFLERSHRQKLRPRDTRHLQSLISFHWELWLKDDWMTVWPKVSPVLQDPRFHSI